MQSMDIFKLADKGMFMIKYGMSNSTFYNKQHNMDSASLSFTLIKANLKWHCENNISLTIFDGHLFYSQSVNN